MTRAVDLLRNKFGVSQLYKHDVVKDGVVELSVYWHPLTIAEREAISKKTGARGLTSILENILLKTMFELPDMENVIKVTVDKASVKGTSEPIVTYGKKSSTSVA